MHAVRAVRTAATAATAAPTRHLPLRVTALAVLLTGAAAACGTEPAERAGSTARWAEPSSYSYTLESSEGERALIGRFRVTVRDGEVAEAVGLDESGERVVQRSLGDVPTIGGLLEECEQARAEGADTAEVEYADDGHPVRISLDWEENAIDDEALYVISDYEPTAP
ncbi:DUF6174 domain-containing protein [Streptomyces acidicola]|uniref:DUF6174 domain-containing protein n=1 Tax=Streptomyces acidicola TaxID=2596892 RepID=UPI0038062087